MKALKIILVTIAAIIGVLFIITLFLPSEMHVEQSITIDAPKPAVFKQVNDLKNWEKWSEWHLMDTTGIFDYSDPSSGQGAKMSWDSDDESLGSGSIEIIESKPYDYIKTRLSFYNEKFGNGEWTFNDIDGKTEVKWEMNGELGFLLKWLKGTMENEVSKQFAEGLEKIKNLAESEPAAEIEISVVDYPEKTIIAIKDTIPMGPDAIAGALSEHYGKLFNFASNNKLEFAGMPMAITHAWDSTQWIFEAALPVASQGKTETDGEIYFTTTPSGQMVHATHIGPYEGLEPVYNELMKYIQENGYQISGNSFEVYANDPTKVAPEEIRTEIYFPVTK